jgi:alkylhydroperoxidase family enzyme
MAHRPAIAAAFFQLYGELWRHGVVEPSVKEVARLRNAHITDCGYWKNVRLAVAGQRLVDDEHATPEHLSAPQRAALEVADAFLAVPPREAPAPARHRLAPEELVELACALALFIGMSKVIIVLGLEPEQMETTTTSMPGTQ